MKLSRIFYPGLYITKEKVIWLKKYSIDLKLILSTKFKQSGINEKEVKEKVIKVLMDSLKENRTLKTLFEGESPVLIFDISKDEENES